MKVGSGGQRVAMNIKTMREHDGLTYAELSRKLDAHGCKIPPLGLRRIEKFERRVDVDELESFAALFDVDISDLVQLEVVPPQDDIFTFKFPKEYS